MNTHRRGAQGGDVAVDYLLKKGYRILERNFRLERAEIDIVAKDKDQIVFVAVKARRSKLYGDQEVSITEAKCRQLWKTAEGYLLKYNLEAANYRFDVIAIQYNDDVPDIRHLIDAF